MKLIAVTILLGILLFGCTLPGGEPQEIPAGGGTPPASVAQHCSDGTSPNACSATAPFYCTASAELVEDAQLCGCPSGTILSEGGCIPMCEDGTAPGECAADRPLYCNSTSQLVEKSSLCGCPSGETVSGDACVRQCTDGTPAGECSANKPIYCTGSSTLVSDPEACGCPSGEVLLNGQCMEARCTDGTPAGECSPNLPLYCTESLTLIDDADGCGCPTGTVAYYNGSSCVSPRLSPKREDSYFTIATDVRMFARNSAHQECEKGDYISVEVQVQNNAYFSSYTISPDIILYVENEDYPGDSGWMPMVFPENDSDCSEPAKFMFGIVPPGGTASGVLWYKLERWDRDADYSLFYGDKYRVSLSPDYE